MATRLAKPWRPLEPAETARLPAQLGVYEIADAAGRVLYVGYAGGRSLWGLRGALEEEGRSLREGAACFRVEITMQYLTRWQELLMAHQADAGALPRDNAERPPARLGRLSPG